MNESVALEKQTIEAPPPRRSFLKRAAAVCIGTIILVVPGIAGLLTLLSPLRKKGGRSTFLPVAPLDALPPDGAPRRFAVVADLTDAWNRYPNSRIGSVYLLRNGEKITAFNTTCPHLGCPVEAKSNGEFRCPCHESAFGSDGSLMPGSVSPRGLDELETRVENGRVLVRYQDFLTGLHDKVPRT